jgi:hypothetical protein
MPDMRLIENGVSIQSSAARRSFQIRDILRRTFNHLGDGTTFAAFNANVGVSCAQSI